MAAIFVYDFVYEFLYMTLLTSMCHCISQDAIGVFEQNCLVKNNIIE